MKHEETVAFITGVIIGLVAGVIGGMVGSSLAAGVTLWGTYIMARGIYKNTKHNSTPNQ